MVNIKLLNMTSPSSHSDRTIIYCPEEYIKNKPKIDGAVVYDGDGDGTSAAAIWLMENPGHYVAITNAHSDEKSLVKRLFGMPMSNKSGLRIGVFDICAEENIGSLEELVKSGARIDYIDHHTKISLPNEIRNYSKPDTREVCTSYLTYLAITKDRLNQSELEKAKHLAILGLANDGKVSAINSSFSETPSDILTELKYFGRVLNYANKGQKKLDFIDLLRTFSSSKEVLSCFHTEKIRRVSDMMDNALKELADKIEEIRIGNSIIYLFPHEGNLRELSESSYNLLLNEKFESAPKSNHIGIISLADINRISVRSSNALRIAQILSQLYQQTEVMGRNTGAGFDTPQLIDPSKVKERLENE